MNIIFESNLFAIAQDEEAVVIYDIRRESIRVLELDDKSLYYELSKCVELSSYIVKFNEDLEKRLLEEDLEKVSDGRYVLKNSSPRELLVRTFTHHLMP